MGINGLIKEEEIKREREREELDKLGFQTDRIGIS